MIKITTTYWRDIPFQVVAESECGKAKIALHRRFKIAVNRSAMGAGKGSSDLYLKEWRWETSESQGELSEVATKHAEQIEQDYDNDLLQSLVRSKGKLKTK